MTADYQNTDEFRGGRFANVDFSQARFTQADFADADFTGSRLDRATFRECDLSGAKLVSSDIGGLRVSGHDHDRKGVFVHDVDVTAYVEAQLDQRHPERVRVREARSADGLRETWRHLELLWRNTVARAERLPDEARHARVDDEWSVTETLRHLVFATDLWVSGMIRGEAPPFHPLALPTTGYPDDSAAAIGIDLDASPTFEDAVAAHADAMARVTAALDGLTDGDLDAMRTAAPAPAWGERTVAVRDCLGVVLDEYCEHRRYAERDLAFLEARDREN
jgi:uncharacterized damage-inducible protein DinB